VNLSEAEAAIAAILSQLEKDAECVVDQVNVIDVDLTCIDDDRQQLYRSVKITMRRLPGQRWA
jgi:hypothetical protein